MHSFDVVIIGAGPAGSYGAFLLAQQGFQVLLVEQHSHFQKNNFSSAATPLETLEQFHLPPSVVAAYWDKLTIVSTNVTQQWKAEQPLGAVFDFAKLRTYLAEQVEKAGGTVWLGHRYLSQEKIAGKTLVKLKPKGQEVITVNTSVLVDATGYARAVMYPHKAERPKFYRGTGIEFLIEVDEPIHQDYADRLVFFLGYRWSPQGYSWIFPMDHHQLKVGSAFVGTDQPHRHLPHLNPLQDYTKAIIQDYLKLDHYRLIEIHGSVLDYAGGLSDIYSRDNVIAIGDAVSTVNFLGGEGIRFAMQGAAIAVPHIVAYLNNQSQDFAVYEQEMKDYFGKKWQKSEQINRRVYLEYTDEKIDLGVAYLKYLNVQDIMALLFDYEFNKIYQGLYPYLLKKVSQWQYQWQRWLRKLVSRE